MSNLNRHIKNDKIKWIATAIALLLISAALVGMCLQVFGKGKQKPSEWFTKPDKQVEQPADKDSTDSGTVDPDAQTADELELSGSFAVSALRANSSGVAAQSDTTQTFDSLPIHCRHIEIGDDLSGATIVLDYPNFAKYGSVSSFASGYLSTSAGYSISKFYSSVDQVGFGSNSMGGYFTAKISLWSYMTVYDQLTSKTKYDYESRSITGYIFPDDAGVVTSIASTGSPSSPHSEIENMYIYDPNYYSYPEYTVTTEMPYSGHTPDCFVPLTVTAQSYTDGFLAVDYPKISSQIGMSVSGGSTNKAYITFNSQYSISAYNGSLAYLSPSASGTTALNIRPATDRYVYFRIDMPSAALTDNAPSDTFYYLPPHEHGEILTESPMDGFGFSDGLTIQNNRSYYDGYLAIDVAAFRERFASTLASENAYKIYQFSSTYDNELYIENGELRAKWYYSHDGLSAYYYDVLIDVDTAADHVYYKANFGVYNNSSGLGSFINVFRYIPSETVTVTLETVSGPRELTVLKNGRLTLESFAGNGNAWYNADGHTMDCIPEDTTFIDVYEFTADGYPFTRLFKPDTYSATLHYTVTDDWGEHSDTDRFAGQCIQGYDDNGNLYVVYDVVRLQDKITRYLPGLDYSPMPVIVTVQAVSLEDRTSARSREFTLGELFNAPRVIDPEQPSIPTDYAFVKIAENDTSRLDLDHTFVTFDAACGSGIVEQGEYTQVIYFWGVKGLLPDGEPYTATVSGSMVKWYNGASSYRFKMSELYGILDALPYNAGYTFEGSYIHELGDEVPYNYMWRFVTEHELTGDVEYAERTVGDENDEFFVQLLYKTITLHNDVNDNTAEIPIRTRSDRDGYWITFLLDSSIFMTEENYDDFLDLAASYTSMSDYDYFDSKYVDNFVRLFCVNNYAAFSGWALDTDHCITNMPTFRVVRVAGDPVEVCGFTVRIPDLVVKNGKYEMTFELVAAKTLADEAEAKPDSFWSGVGDGVKGMFNFGKDGWGWDNVFTYLKIALIVVGVVLICVALAKLIQVIAKLFKK